MKFHLYKALCIFLAFSIGPNIYASSESLPSTHDTQQILFFAGTIDHLFSGQNPSEEDLQAIRHKFNTYEKQGHEETIQATERLISQLHTDLQTSQMRLGKFSVHLNDQIYATIVFLAPEVKPLIDALPTILPSTKQESRKKWSQATIAQTTRPFLRTISQKHRMQIADILTPLINAIPHTCSIL